MDPGATGVATTVVALLVTLHFLQHVLHAAQPAVRPWPRRPGPTARRAADPSDWPRLPARVVSPHRPGARPVTGPVRAPDRAPAPAGGTRRGGRGAARRRGRRGGANWRRHGGTGADQLIVGHLNVQSYKPKLPDMRHDIHEVYGFDILAICETWLTPNVPDRLLGVSGYRLYRRDRPAELGLPRGRGGVAVLVRDSLSCELLPTPATGVVGSNLEIVWVLVHPDKHQPVLVASAYRVPTNTAGQLAADLEDLENQLQFMLASYPRATLVVCGDFNNCLLKSARAGSPNPLSSMLDTYGLRVTNSSRATYRPASSLLDVIATNRPELVQRAGVTRCHYGGPHDFTRVMLSRASRPSTQRAGTVYRRAMNKIDAAAFCQQLTDTDWTGVFDSDTTVDKWLHFQTAFLSELDTVAPLRRVRDRRSSAPPVSADTQQLLQRRRAALAGGGRAAYKEANRLPRAVRAGDQGEQSRWAVASAAARYRTETATVRHTADNP